MKDLLASGQLHLCKIPAGKNPAALLTRYLPASILHKLLPKLGVRTRAADSRGLLSMLNIELRAPSRGEQSSFFIGMMAELPHPAQLVDPRVASCVIPSSSFGQHSQEEVPTVLQTRRTFCMSSLWWSLSIMAGLLYAELCAPDSFVKLQISSFLPFDCPVQLTSDTVTVSKQWAFRMAFWTRSLRSTLLCSHEWQIRFLTFLASGYSGHRVNVQASFAQISSISSSLGIIDSFHISAALKMAYFTHEQLIPLLLANEAYALPPALLQHVIEGKLFNDELEELCDKISPQWVSDNLPKLPKRDELQFWMVLGEKATKSFENSDFQQLPPQKVHQGSYNPNLSSWRPSSSFAKAVNFWAWTACRAPELLKEAAYVISFKITVIRFVQQHKALQLGDSASLDFRGAGCQLCFWGKPASAEQPYFGSLRIELGNMWVQLAPFENMPQLYDRARFDWGTASREHQLAASWTQDLQQNVPVYQQLQAKLGSNHALAQLIQKELDKDVEEPPFKRLRTSAARASFWQETDKSFHRTLGALLSKNTKI